MHAPHSDEQLAGMVRARPQTFRDRVGAAKPGEELGEERRRIYALALRNLGSTHPEVGPHVRCRRGVLREDVGL